MTRRAPRFLAILSTLLLKLMSCTEISAGTIFIFSVEQKDKNSLSADQTMQSHLTSLSANPCSHVRHLNKTTRTDMASMRPGYNIRREIVHFDADDATSYLASPPLDHTRRRPAHLRTLRHVQPPAFCPNTSLPRSSALVIKMSTSIRRNHQVRRMPPLSPALRRPSAARVRSAMDHDKADSASGHLHQSQCRRPSWTRPG
jgi:hypothetical protein